MTSGAAPTDRNQPPLFLRRLHGERQQELVALVAAGRPQHQIVLGWRVLMHDGRSSKEYGGLLTRCRAGAIVERGLTKQL